jgi:hypothetical protein
VARPTLRELKSRPYDRNQVALRAERDSDGARVLIRASEIVEEERESGLGYSLVRTSRPPRTAGIVVLSGGLGFLAIGFIMYGISGFRLDSPIGPGGEIGVGIMGMSALPISLGAVLIGISTRNFQEVQAGKLAVELGAWPVPQY